MLKDKIHKNQIRYVCRHCGKVLVEANEEPVYESDIICPRCAEKYYPELREQNPPSTVSIWFSKDYFTRSSAKMWLENHDKKSKITQTENFLVAVQNPRLAKLHRGKVRSKYISQGIMIKFVPVRFL